MRASPASTESSPEQQPRRRQAAIMERTFVSQRNRRLVNRVVLGVLGASEACRQMQLDPQTSKMSLMRFVRSILNRRRQWPPLDTTMSSDSNTSNETSAINSGDSQLSSVNHNICDQPSNITQSDISMSSDSISETRPKTHEKPHEQDKTGTP